MRCIRVFVFILLLVFTACATCSSLFPLFSKTTNGTKQSVYFWYRESSSKDATKTHTIIRTYNRDAACDKFKLFYTVCGALAAAGAAFGGIATLMSLAHIYIRPKCCMCFGIIMMAFLAFACFVVCVALTTVSYTTDSCSTSEPKLKDNYNIVEGFGLMCAAAGGFLISFIFEMCA